MAKIQIPVPLGGLNTISTVLTDLNYARELTNYVLYEGQLLRRPGISIPFVSSLTSEIYWYDPETSPVNCILKNGNIRTITNVGASSIGGAPAFQPTRVKHISLDFVIGAREPRLAIYPFTAWTFTTSVVTATAISSACSYKGRFYVCNGTVLEYSNVGQVTGAMYDSVDLSEFLDGQTIIRIFSLTVQPGNGNEVVMAIFCDGGKVLIFQGDYPASSTWNLMGNFDMPASCGPCTFVEIDGDIWVSSVKYCYWARDLLTGGAQTAYENSPTRIIENLWNSVTRWDSSNIAWYETPHAFYIQPLDIILVQPSEICDGVKDSADYNDNPSTGFFVYNRKYKAWSFWMNAPFCHPVISTNSTLSVGKTEVYYGAEYTYLKKISLEPNDMIALEDGDQITPGSLPETKVETSWKTPYFGAMEGKVTNVSGVRPLYFDPSGDFFKARIIFDFSDFNTSVQFAFFRQSTSPDPILPTNYADGDAAGLADKSVYNPFISVSGSGGSVSLQLSQIGNSSGNQLMLGATLYTTDGGDMI